MYLLVIYKLNTYYENWYSSSVNSLTSLKCDRNQKITTKYKCIKY